MMELNSETFVGLTIYPKLKKSIFFGIKLQSVQLRVRSPTGVYV